MKAADRGTTRFDQLWTLGARGIGLMLVIAGASATDALAQGEPAESGEITLESLQAEIELLKAAKEVQPTIGGKTSTMKFFGRIHMDSWSFPDSSAGINVLENGDPSDAPDEQFFFRRARIGMSGKVSPNMYYKSVLDFAKPNRLAFKDLYIGWENLPVVQKLQIGNQKRPYGLDSLNSSNSNVFMERPMVVDSVTPDARRLGILAYGLSEDQNWNWRYGIQNPIDVANTGVIPGQSGQYEVSGRLANTAWYESEGRDYGHWAISAAVSNVSDDPVRTAAIFQSRPEGASVMRWINTGRVAGTDHYSFVGLEGVANYGPTQLTAELQGVQVSRQASTGSDLDFWGGYFYVARFLTGEHMPWNRKNGTLGRPKPKRDAGTGSWGAWQVAARYSYADFSSHDIQGGLGQSLTLGVNWLLNANANIQFNYLFGDISERSETVGATTYDGGDYQILGIRFRMTF